MLPLSTSETSPPRRLSTTYQPSRLIRSRYARYEITSVNGANNVVSGNRPGQDGPSAFVAPIGAPVCAIGVTGIGSSHAVWGEREAGGASGLSGMPDAPGTVAMNSVNVGRGGTNEGTRADEGGTERRGSGGAIAAGGGEPLRDAALREAATEAVEEVERTVTIVFPLLHTRWRNASFSSGSASILL